MKYAHTDVIEKATTLFWKKGYLAAGMRDIQNALDMRPGSIYARFKSKEGLFTLVIEHYADNSKKQLNEVANAANPLNALKEFFVQTLTCSNDEHFKRQCLIVKSMIEFDMLGESGKHAVMSAMHTLKQCFITIIEKAIQTNNLPKDTPIETAADWLQNQFIALRMFALTQNDNTAIAVMVDKVLLDLKNQWPQ